MLLPESVSTVAPHIDRLFWIILGITGFFFFLVQGLLLVFVVIYLEKKGRTAQYLHGNTLLEIVWTVIPALILLWLTIASQRVWAEIRSPRTFPAHATPIEITAEQFAWNIRYAGPDGLFNTADDVSTINQLHLPIGEPVNVSLKSKDVIHSFFLPEFRIKQDAVPGMTTRVWLQATKEGQYEIFCAELCGLGHYRMRGQVKIEPRAALEAWLSETKKNE